MANKKYINTGELAGLTGCLDEEIRELAKNGVLPAHKTRRGHWRFNVDAAEKHFGIAINSIIDLDDKEDGVSHKDKNDTLSGTGTSPLFHSAGCLILFRLTLFR